MENGEQFGNIYVFSSGDCKPLNALKAEGIEEFGNNNKLGVQLEGLVSIVENLGRTVNRNALYVSKISERTKTQMNKLIEKDQLTSILNKRADILENLPYQRSVQTQLKEKSLKVATERENKAFSALLEYLKEERHSRKELEESVKNLKNEIETLKAKKVDKQEFSILSNDLSSLNEHYRESRKKEEEAQKINSDKFEQTNRNFDQFEQRTKTELKFFSMKLEDLKKSIEAVENQGHQGKRIGSITDLSSCFVEIDLFKEYQETQIRLFDGLEKRVEQVSSELIEELIGDKIKEFQWKLNSKKNKGDAENDKTEEQRTSNFNDLDEGVEDRLEEIERNMNKKIIRLDSRLKELEDLKKLNKTISRIQIDMNMKINRDIYDQDNKLKLSKTEFFDFVNTNLITLDQLKTFQMSLEHIKEKFNESEKHQKQSIDQLERTFEEESQLSRHSFSEIDLNLGHLKKGQSSDHNQISQLIEKFDTLNLSFKKTHDSVFNLINQRILSLAKTKPQLCLSCGHKDINYPPILEHGPSEKGFVLEQGAIKEGPFVCNGERMDRSKKDIYQGKPSSATTKLTKETIKRQIGENSGFKIKNFKKPASSNPKFHVNGTQVFDKVYSTYQHNLSAHQPVDQMLKHDIITQIRARPFSSIPKKAALFTNNNK